MASPGKLVKPQTEQGIKDLLRAAGNRRGAGLRSMPGSFSVGPQQRRQQSPRPDFWIKGKVTNFASCGGGHYNARSVSGITTATRAGNEVQPDGMTVVGDEDILFVNLFENGTTKHVLPQGTFFYGRIVGYDRTNLLKKVEGYCLPPGVHFAVKVEKTGGSDGTKTTKATWTYTVRTIAWNGSSGGDTLGTGMAVTRPRANGKRAFQAGSTGYGVAFYDNGTLKLWDAGEVKGTAGC